MTYTVGTAHGPFTGTGSFVIAKPAGIRTIVTAIPSYTGHDGSVPTRFFRLGRFTLGNSHGYQQSQPIEYSQQLIYPIPPVWELLAYDIRDGASCTFYELVDVPDLTAKQPWDRTPQAVVQSAAQQLTGGTGLTTAFSYTVPVGRRYFVSQMSASLRRFTIGSAAGGVAAQLFLNGSLILRAQFYTNIAGERETANLSGGPMILGPGAIVLANGYNGDTGGDVRSDFLVNGFLFDA